MNQLIQVPRLVRGVKQTGDLVPNGEVRLPSLPPQRLRELDSQFLDGHGGVRLRPASAWHQAFGSGVPHVELTLWCYAHGFYGLPTIELIEWLRPFVAGRKALEIGAGATGLGRHLGIPMSDSGIQSTAFYRTLYARIGQAPTEPGPDVERLDALDALRKHRPQVVIASWVTRRFRPGIDREGVAQAFIEGVDENALLDFPSVETYIHIGNEQSHGQKLILSRPHRVLRPSWLMSRSVAPDKNVIYVWDRSGGTHA